VSRQESAGRPPADARRPGISRPQPSGRREIEVSGPAGGMAPVLSIPEIRDYRQINAELARRLDAGAGRGVLAGVEGQRLLASGLSGAWRAVVEVEGDAGPELVAGLDAPGLMVICRGTAADGAACGLHAGSVLILGDAGDAAGYNQAGGTVV